MNEEKGKMFLGDLVPREIVERMAAKAEEEREKWLERAKYPSCAECEHAVLVSLKLGRYRRRTIIKEFKDYCELGLKFEGWDSGKRTEECKGLEEGEPLVISGKKGKRMRKTEFMQYLGYKLGDNGWE